MQLQIAKTDFS